MALSTKRRKTKAGAARVAPTCSATGTIKSFAKPSKPGLSRRTPQNTKEHDHHIPSKTNCGRAPPKGAGAKRKAESPVASSSGNPSKKAKTGEGREGSHARRESVAPGSERPPPKPEEKEHPRAAEHLLSPRHGQRPPEASVPSPPPSTARSFSPARSADTSPISPEPVKGTRPPRDSVKHLPGEVQDFLGLCTVFTRTLSLHHAHNGAFSPADLRDLRPGIERAWGKRRVGLDDIRRILGVLGGSREKDASLYQLSLVDYGCGKICLETSNPPVQGAPVARPMDVAYLDSRFSRNIQDLYDDHASDDSADFLQSLPLASIERCASASKTGPLLGKGVSRLSDIKGRRAQAQLSAVPAEMAPWEPSPPCRAPASRASSLLDRILAKQAVQAKLPAPPTPEERARRSASLRLAEVIPVLEALTGSGGHMISPRGGAPNGLGADTSRSTVTLTMPALVENLQTSLRNPIGAEEAARCVTLAAEVLPGWVGVTKAGRVTGVTIRRNNAMCRREWAKRVEELLE
jgi:hypothetical protein